MLPQNATVSLLVAQSEATFSLRHMLENLGPIGYVVVGLLFLMSVWSFGVMIDRALMFAAARKQSRLFVHHVAGALRDGRLDDAILIAERHKKSHLAKVTASGLAEFQSASAKMRDEKIVESARRSLDRANAIVHAELERGLAGLATIGSTAPFVGLFGTVVGILKAFSEIARHKGSGISIVAGGISEALITTALGLLVALPAVWAYNTFASRVKSFDVEMENSSMELVNYFVARLEERR